MKIVPAEISRKTVGIFCSADDKVPDEFKSVAYELGKKLREKDLGIVTGGSNTGLMKEVIDGYVELSSELHYACGVIPESFKSYDIQHRSIPEENLTWTESLHSRLAAFHEKCSVIVVLPGGFGTLHELMDFLVHNQLGLIQVPIIVVNVDGFWNDQFKQFEKMVEKNCLEIKHLSSINIIDTLEGCLEIIDNSSLGGAS